MKVVKYDHNKHYNDVLGLELRLSDIEELKASSDTVDETNYIYEVIRSIYVSEEVYSVYEGEELIAVFGISVLDTNQQIASPWFLGSDKVAKYYIPFVRDAKKQVHKWSNKYELLVNYVHEDQAESIKWLSLLGFNVDREYTTYGNSDKFYMFYKLSNKVEERT